MTLRPEELLHEPFIITNETGNSDGRRRHLVPDPKIVPPDSPMWMTRCGLGWEERRWYHVVPIGSGNNAASIRWCDECLAVEGLRFTPPAEELYERAVREWIARHYNGRRTRVGSAFEVTANDVRNVRYGIDFGWSSDVTPPEDPEPVIAFEVRLAGKWEEHDLGTPLPAELVAQCLAIVDELRVVPAS